MIHKALWTLPVAAFAVAVGVPQAFPETKPWFTEQWGSLVEFASHPTGLISLLFLFGVYIFAVAKSSKQDELKVSLRAPSEQVQPPSNKRKPLVEAIQEFAAPDMQTANLPPLPAQPRDRVFVENLSYSELMELGKDAPSIQAERLKRNFIGKWMRISGTMATASEHGGTIFVGVDVPRMLEGYNLRTTLWADFPGDRERLELKREGDLIDAVGQINKIKSMEIEFENCELIIPGQENLGVIDGGTF